MDAFSQILRAFRLEASIFLETEFTSPWCIDSSPGKVERRYILPSATHLSLYHLVVEGRCRARLTDETASVELATGDLILFPRGDGHLMGSDVTGTPVPAEKLIQLSREGGLARIVHGGGGERTRFVCGYLACDSRLCRPMLEALPRMLRVPLRDHAAAAWMVKTLEHAAEESRAPRPGTEAVLTKLAELLFVEGVRSYMETLPAQERSWLGALRDPHVSRVLRAMHAEPARQWTVNDLGREAGLSRSALAERFAFLIGEPPMQYLQRWRLALGAKALEEGSDPIVQVAQRVGYESEAAFNRAFKREFGKPPAAWRRQRAQPRRAT
jgi:AraC-like DNA-binding protein